MWEFVIAPQETNIYLYENKVFCHYCCDGKETEIRPGGKQRSQLIRNSR
jgi:hypothetical protein